MCVVSMVGDHYTDKWKYLDWTTVTVQGTPTPGISLPQYVPSVSRAEFDALKRDVEEMKALLIRAVEYDKRNNEPHCEMDEKVALLKMVAEAVGVDLSKVFAK